MQIFLPFAYRDERRGVSLLDALPRVFRRHYKVIQKRRLKGAVEIIGASIGLLKIKVVSIGRDDLLRL